MSPQQPMNASCAKHPTAAVPNLPAPKSVPLATLPAARASNSPTPICSAYSTERPVSVTNYPHTQLILDRQSVRGVGISNPLQPIVRSSAGDLTVAASNLLAPMPFSFASAGTARGFTSGGQRVW